MSKRQQTFYSFYLTSINFFTLIWSRFIKWVFALPTSPALNLYLPPPAVNLFLPALALNLCSPNLRFIVKVCYSCSVYLHKLSVDLYVLTFLSIMWQTSILFNISSQQIFSIFLIRYNSSRSVHFHFAIQLLQSFYFWHDAKL